MKGQIKLCYRKEIEAGAETHWERGVFDNTFKEFLIQAQQFDPSGEYNTFSQMKEFVPRVDELTYLVSTAAMGYLKAMEGLIPDIVDAVGKLCIPFKNFQFEIIKSDLRDKTSHKVAINFYSEWLTWIDTIDEKVLLTAGDKQIDILKGEEVETHMVSLRDQFQIAMFKSK